MEMRRKDLQITDPAEIDDIIRSCGYFRLAFADGTHPYIVPLNFGFTHENGVRRLYFHSAAAGRKVDLCRKLGYAGFEMDTGCLVKPDAKACDFSMRYRSVIGEGPITEIGSVDEKKQALQILMGHYAGRTDWEMPESVLERTCVFCLTVEEISGKAHG